MSQTHRLAILSVPLLALAFGLFLPEPASAGCGCDHPPPAWLALTPPFASPGTTVRVHADGFEFQVGSPYEVDFGGSGKTFAVARDLGALEVVVPPDAKPGPAAVKVKGPGDVDHAFDKSLFTVLAPAPSIPAGDGIWVIRDYKVSVATDGSLLVPLDVEQVLDGTQFAFQFGHLPLTFGQEDVAFFNADGVDLTLFTIDVADLTERQWGSYYGWTVEQDTGITGEVYDNKVLAPLQSFLSDFLVSDLLTYWRHEFHSYRNAHAPGGSHEVGSDGFHVQQGTLHIDHDRLVLAISGLERGGFDADSALDSLDPGTRQVNLYISTKVSDKPIEPEVMQNALTTAILQGQLQAMTLEPSED